MEKLVFTSWLLMSSLALSGQGQEHRSRLSKSDTLGSLARARTLTQLEELWSRDPKDFPHRAIHASVYKQLGGADPDATLIAAMPIDGREMETLYDAQDTDQGQDMIVTNGRSGYYTSLADALGRHPDKLPQFLRMIHAFHYVDNVDEWPSLCGLASKLYHSHPEQFLIAVNRLKDEGYKREALECREPPDYP